MSINNSNGGGGGPVDVSTLKQDNPILSWSGQKSVLSKSMDEDRKRSNEKSLDEEYDDEFDQGRTKKVRRSRSLPRETESGGIGNRFQNIEDRKKQVEQWTSFMDGNGTGGGFRRNSGGGGGNGSTAESRSWLNNGDNEDPTRFKRNFPQRSSFNNGNNGPRPRHSSSNGSHSSSNYSLNSHGRSPFRNGHHSGSNGGSHFRSQSQNSYHHNSGNNKFWGGDRTRH